MVKPAAAVIWVISVRSLLSPAAQQDPETHTERLRANGTRPRIGRASQSARSRRLLTTDSFRDGKSHWPGCLAKRTRRFPKDRPARFPFGCGTKRPALG